MIASVRVGDQCKMINTNCKSGVVLEYLKKCAGLDSSALVDLCDKDGNVRSMLVNPFKYASTCLKTGETYYLVKAEKKDSQLVYTLMCNLKSDEPSFEIRALSIDKSMSTSKKPYKSSAIAGAAAAMAHKLKQISIQ